MKIRNKKTGEIRDVPSTQLPSYGLGMQSSPSMVSKQPQPQAAQPSNIPAAVGQFAGGILGTPGGPIGRTAGAALGAGVGQEVAQAQAGQPGDPGAVMASFLPPVDLIRRLKKGSSTDESPTEKAMKVGAMSQLSAESIGMFTKLLKPKTWTGMANDLTEYVSKKSGGKPIPIEDVQNAMANKMSKIANESVSRGETAASAEKASKVLEGIPSDTGADSEVLNILRKRLNFQSGPFSKWSPEEQKFAQAFSEVVKDFQTQLAPATKATIGLQKTLSEHIPTLFDLLALGNQKVGAGVRSLIGSGLSAGSGVLEKLAQYGLSPLVQGAVNKNKK